MNIGNPAVGAIGFEIFIVTGLDLEPATDIKILARKPDGEAAAWIATAADKGVSRGNRIYGAKYVTASADDLDQAGEWELQVAVIMPGFTGPGAIAHLTVVEALPEPPGP